MAAPRLPFLWPALFRPPPHASTSHSSSALVSRVTGNASTAAAVTCRPALHQHRPPPRAALFSSSSRARQQTSSSTTRYGTANEPLPPSLPSAAAKGNRKDAKQEKGSDASSSDQKEAPKSQSAEIAKDKTPIGNTFTPTTPAEDVALLKPPSKKSPDTSNTSVIPPPSNDQTTTSTSETSKNPPEQAEPAATAANALTTILRMEPPMSSDANAEDKPPHLQAPPYTHHFDTYTLVKNLQGEAGWSEAQAIEVMKAMRGLLLTNMDLARDGYVSKGDAEMESYLFRAACSELRTEIRQRRSTAQSEMTSQRTQLQHEVDILGQRIGQETSSLKDELKGMFDDRKMAVRMERRTMENRIQELNYKITIALNSEMRSEVEGLRWVITRRVVIALAAVVAGALALLRFSKSAEARSATQRHQLEQQQQAQGDREPGRDVGTQAGGDMGLGAPDMLKRLDAGDSPSLVSLG